MKPNSTCVWLVRTILFGVLLLVLHPIFGFAQQPGFQRYTSRDGIPEIQITAIFQDHRGILWIGTYTGLIRYNGSWAEVIDNEDGLSNASISALCEDADGRLLIGTDGGGVNVYDGVSFQTLRAPDTLYDDSVYAIACDGAGTVWIATEYGLTAITKERSTRYRLGSDLPFSRCYDIVPDSTGGVWLATDNGLARHTQAGFEQIPFAEQQDFPKIHYLDFDGRDLRASGDGTVFVLRDGSLHRLVTMPAGDARYINALATDERGNLWIGTWAGAFRLKDDKLTRYTSAHGLSNTTVNDIIRDREGSLWFATEGGVTRLSRGNFVFYNERDGLPSSDVIHVHEDARGRLWVGTARGAAILEGDQWKTLTTKNGLADDYIICFAKGPDGGMFIVTDSAVQLWKNGEVHLLQRDLNAVSIETDSRSRTWLGTRKGLYLLNGDTFELYGDNQKLRDAYINTIEEDAQGRIWVGTNRDGCFIIGNSGIKVYDSGNGLTNLDIWTICRAHDGSVWIGTNGAGAFKWDGKRFATYDHKLGLISNYIWQILADDRGGVWFGTDKGLDYLRSGAITHYSTTDGLAANDGTQDTCLQDSHGRIWFASSHGLSLVSEYPEPSPAGDVPILIEQVVLNGKALTSWENLRLQPGERTLFIRFAGIEYQHSARLQYRYRLSNDDAGWNRLAGGSDVLLGNLAPGNYRFEVAASVDNGASWSSTPSFLDFQVEPPFYLSWWFLLSGTVVVLAVGFGAHQMQLRRNQQEKNRLERMVQSRTAELSALNAELANSVKELEAFSHMVSHDLRAPLTRISGFINLLKNVPCVSMSGESTTYIARIVDNCRRMDELIKDLLRFSQATKQQIHAEEIDIALIARDIFNQLKQGNEDRHCTFRVPERLKVHTDARLIRIVLENLLGNAWKYTGTRQEAEIELGAGTNDQGETVYFVRDNGVGFDPSRAGSLFVFFSRLHEDIQFPGLGIGLVTAQRIIARLGGRIWAESKEGKGATFTFTLP